MNIVVMIEEGAVPKLNVVRGSHNLVNHILGTESQRNFGELLHEDYEMMENAADSFSPIQVEYPTGSPILSLENVFHGGLRTPSLRSFSTPYRGGHSIRQFTGGKTAAGPSVG
jgi:hypothetical protein